MFIALIGPQMRYRWIAALWWHKIKLVQLHFDKFMLECLLNNRTKERTRNFIVYIFNEFKFSWFNLTLSMQQSSVSYEIMELSVFTRIFNMLLDCGGHLEGWLQVQWLCERFSKINPIKYLANTTETHSHTGRGKNITDFFHILQQMIIKSTILKEFNWADF